MNLSFGAKIITCDYVEAGILKELVVHPAARTVTHLVIQQGLLTPNDAVVPVAIVATAEAGTIILTVTAVELEHGCREARADSGGPRPEPAGTAPGTAPKYWLWTQPPDRDALPQTPPSLIPPGVGRVEMPAAICVPPDMILLDPGTPVESADRKTIGRVAEVQIDPTWKISHLVIREGHVFKVPKLVPADWFSRLEDNQIYLSVSFKQVDDLPEWRPQPA